MPKKRFENLDGVQNLKSFRDIRQWRKERKGKVKDLSYRVPQAERQELDTIFRGDRTLAITWIGHSTFWLRIGGLTVATDPVWARSMGFTGRLAPPGVALADVPPPDVVLISHGHYDHLDFPTLRRLQGDPLFLVPAGLGAKFRRKGYRRVEEFEWWETKRLARAEFHFVPAQHWTRRTLTDTNKSHWGGWVIRETDTGDAGARTVYFAGDSGYFRGFKEIGDRFAIDYALMPIGAYEPEWFMSMQHVTPEEAVQAYLDTRSRYFVPMHYGAFRLADDTPKEAIDRLIADWQRRGLDTERLKLLIHGETLVHGGPEVLTR